jgi:hypothetical protein
MYSFEFIRTYEFDLKVNVALKKNGSFAFAEGSACTVGAKANVPFV